MSGAALLRLVILMVPVLLTFVALVGAGLSLRSTKAPGTDAVYLEHSGAEANRSPSP